MRLTRPTDGADNVLCNFEASGEAVKTILCYGDSNTWGSDPETGERFAEQFGCEFLDASQLIVSSDVDGIHLDASEHGKLGRAVARIREIFG